MSEINPFPYTITFRFFDQPGNYTDSMEIDTPPSQLHPGSFFTSLLAGLTKRFEVIGKEGSVFIIREQL